MLVCLLILFLLHALTHWEIFKSMTKLFIWFWLVELFFGIGLIIGVITKLF
jgi:hypothetical protein